MLLKQEISVVCLHFLLPHAAIGSVELCYMCVSSLQRRAIMCVCACAFVCVCVTYNYSRQCLYINIHIYKEF